ncbi:MAG: aminoglycoside phosphotransferase family protein [Anaerolineae bacterium]|nr:aminoglycoside phosphotransferase family protein [Anaerolineae bacterium]
MEYATIKHMKTQANIDKRQLGRWLVDHYNLKPERARFLPYGECGWIYNIHTADATYMLKLKQPHLCASGSFDQQIINTHMALYYDYGIRQISEPPVRATTGEYINQLGDYDAILVPFIDGTPAYDMPLTELLQRKLGSLIATLHRCKLHADERPPVERFSLQFARKLGNMLSDIRGTEFDRSGLNRWQQQTADALKQLYPELKKRAAQFVTLAKVLRSDQTLIDNFVLCHGDPSSGNVIVSPDNNVYLIDWDAPIMAPPERDLFFLKQWPMAMENYQNMMDYPELDVRVMHYYTLEWDLQEVVEFGERILYGDHDERQNEHDWTELEAHLKEFGYL